MAASFAIVTQLGGARTVEVLRDHCPRNKIRVKSRPSPAGTSRDYFVTCDGKEPEECHMIIRSRAPVAIGAALPAGAFWFCSGDCDDRDTECKDTGVQVDATTSMIYCSCTFKALRKEILEFLGRSRKSSRSRR